MLKVFILEDNLQQLAELQTITKQVLAKLNITDSLVFPFSSTSRLTKALPEPSLDNVFILDLSINDNKQAGLQLSQLIRQVDHLATIIFITVHDELLPTTYKYRVQALDFISKDHDNVAHELLTDFHLIAQRKQEAKTDAFSYRIYNQTQTILLDDICYFKSNNGNTHSATIYTIDHRTIEIHQNLHEIGKADKRFFRVHRSYLVNAVLLFITFRSLLLIFLLLLVVPLIIYFFVTHRQQSYTFVASNYIFVTMTLFIAMAIIGPTVIGIYGHFSPQTAVIFSNWGGDFIVIVEGLVAYALLKRFVPTYRRYIQVVIHQRPLFAWLVNVVYASFYFIRFGYHIQVIKLPTPVYVLVALGYFLLVLATVKVSANYFSYYDLTVNQAVELRNLQTYTSHIEAMYDDLRRFRHDYKNILLSLQDTIKNGTIDQVRKMFDQIVLPTNDNVEIRTAVLGHIANIEDLEIKSLVYSKVMAAINKQIDVTVEVVDPIKLSAEVDTVDVLRMISILLDNAVNAALLSAEKKVNFSFFTKDGAQYIVVGNSTKQAQIDLQKLAGNFNGLTSSRHSLGLRNLRILLAKYPFIQHNSSSNHHWVEQAMIIHPQGK